MNAGWCARPGFRSMNSEPGAAVGVICWPIGMKTAVAALAPAARTRTAEAARRIEPFMELSLFRPHGCFRANRAGKLQNRRWRWRHIFRTIAGAGSDLGLRRWRRGAATRRIHAEVAAKTIVVPTAPTFPAFVVSSPVDAARPRALRDGACAERGVVIQPVPSPTPL